MADGAPERDRFDWVAVEAPLEIRIGPKPATVLMRTPGDDEELVRGFLFSEGIIASADDIVSLGRPPNLTGPQQGNVMVVQLAGSRKGPTIDRNFYSSSSCGVCGKKTIAALEVKGAIATSRLTVERSVLATLPDRLRAAQPTFAKTGGVHASGLFTPDGELLLVREDVGRHNALDKLIGWALTAGKIPLSDYLLLVSGRVSYEIVQKAVSASLPLIAAVGAPSSLAVELAERFNLTLVGFLRPDTMNVYANAARVVE
ncbi:sufurtransferase FdhD [Planctomycetaceae bacterium SCGC AG-212-F19]|nr:sufurtransferase FdhD [Planctomycetaceae bacterium SCGC AG-212-F19]